MLQLCFIFSVFHIQYLKCWMIIYQKNQSYSVYFKKWNYKNNGKKITKYKIIWEGSNLRNNCILFSLVNFCNSSCKKFSVLVFLKSKEFFMKHVKMIPLNTWQFKKIFISAFWFFFPLFSSFPSLSGSQNKGEQTCHLGFSRTLEKEVPVIAYGVMIDMIKFFFPKNVIIKPISWEFTKNVAC